MRKTDLEVSYVDSREIVRPVAILELHFVVFSEGDVAVMRLLDSLFLVGKHTQSKL